MSETDVELMRQRTPGTESRILFFTSSLGRGGAEKHVVRVINHLPRHLKPSVAVIRGGGDYEDELPPEVPLHVLPARRLRSAVRPLRRLVQRKRPDLLCSVQDVPNTVAVAATFGLAEAPPLVLCVQNTISINLGRTLGLRLLRSAIPWIYRRADHVVALSEGVRDDLLRLAPALQASSSVIYNAGYDRQIDRLAREPLPETPPGTGPLLVACGRLTRQKGFDLLLRALAHVRTRFPARLWIVGEGDLRGELGDLAEELGISEAVWFAGFRGNPYVFMRQADVFVLSSRWEGFGNVVVEAMAVGVPVLATDCPHGPREILEPSNAGLLVEPGDPEALAMGVIRLLEDPELRERYAAAGRERAKDFSAGRIAMEYANLFESVVGLSTGRVDA